MKRIKNVVLSHPRFSALTAGAIAAAGTTAAFIVTSGAASACCAWAR